jgi:hypothetical protein
MYINRRVAVSEILVGIEIVVDKFPQLRSASAPSALSTNRLVDALPKSSSHISSLGRG